MGQNLFFGRLGLGQNLFFGRLGLGQNLFRVGQKSFSGWVKIFFLEGVDGVGLWLVALLFSLCACVVLGSLGRSPKRAWSRACTRLVARAKRNGRQAGGWN